jgi:hypothetical protein
MWTALMRWFARRRPRPTVAVPTCSSPDCTRQRDERDARVQEDVQQRLDRIEGILNEVTQMWDASKDKP